MNLDFSQIGQKTYNASLVGKYISSYDTPESCIFSRFIYISDGYFCVQQATSPYCQTYFSGYSCIEQSQKIRGNSTGTTVTSYNISDYPADGTKTVNGTEYWYVRR